MPKGVYIHKRGIDLTDKQVLHFKKLHEKNRGRSLTKEHKLKISRANKGGNKTSFKKGHITWYPGRDTSALQGKNNHNWKDDDVGYRSLHDWVRAKLGTPDTCEKCGKSGLKGCKIHWANKSGEYKRDIKDWLRLCVSCHKKYDYKKGFWKPWNKK